MPYSEAPAGVEIAKVCDDLKELLIAKNIAYGNSFADPINIFSKTTPVEQLCVRIDDKLNRILKGREYPGDDTITDLIGYLVLYKILVKNIE
jgi:hypothetical protein